MEEQNTKPIIAVIAHQGMVGSTVLRYYSERGHEVMGWSRSAHTHELEEIVERADFIFVCVPTPFVWGLKRIDLSALYSTLDNLKGSMAPIIIKSTILPTTTTLLQAQYRELKLLFNPEFLSEATAYIDFVNPDRQIVGHTVKSYKVALEVLNLLPNSPYDVIMPSTEAEIVKYVNNFHGALMVIFSNLIYDICNTTGAVYGNVKKASLASKWVGSPMGRMYWNVDHGGFRGYGGKCFPKDINSLLSWCKEFGIDAEILEATVDANKRLLKVQNMTEEMAEKRSSRV